MNPVTHFLAGWTLAASAPIERRERALVALAGVAPDVDGLGLVVDVLTAHSANPTELWGRFHHVLGHNLGFGLALSCVAWMLARRRIRTALLVLLSFHLHLIGDLVGARGPDGEQWPFSYLTPFSERWIWIWSGQWALNAWPNVLLTVALLGASFWLAWRYALSPLELVSDRANRALLATLRARFGTPRHGLGAGSATGRGIAP